MTWPTWPIGAHFCRPGYTEARAHGLAFTWLHADGFTDDPRSIEVHDAAGLLGSGLHYILTFSLRHPGLLTDGPRWCGYVEMARDRLQAAGALDRCLAVQFDDEFYSHLHRHGEDLAAAAVHVAARAADTRRILASAVGAGVGMAETGGVRPPTAGIDWWGLNVYLADGYYSDPTEVARIYAEAARLGRPLMPILPVFADGDADAPVQPLDVLASCYLPLLARHAAVIWAIGLFCWHHPSQDAPRDHRPGRGVLELGEPYRSAVRALTAIAGRG